MKFKILVINSKKVKKIFLRVIKNINSILKPHKNLILNVSSILFIVFEIISLCLLSKRYVRFGYSLKISGLTLVLFAHYLFYVNEDN